MTGLFLFVAIVYILSVVIVAFGIKDSGGYDGIADFVLSMLFIFCPILNTLTAIYLVTYLVTL